MAYSFAFRLFPVFPLVDYQCVSVPATAGTFFCVPPVPAVPASVPALTSSYFSDFQILTTKREQREQREHDLPFQNGKSSVPDSGGFN